MPTTPDPLPEADAGSSADAAPQAAAAAITPDSTIAEVYRHPIGRDIVDKLLMQLGRSRRWVTNPIVRRMPLRRLTPLSLGRFDADFIGSVIRLLNQEPDTPRTDPVPLQRAWWKEAVVYQVYPRSFMDGNGDGIGDLPGIIQRLDYLQELGVDALWLSPIYDSPNDDNGYDIRDYRAVMAEFGTMADFEELVAGLRRRGMRLIMDLVVNHTSDEHEWFRQALADEHSPYRDYYFLRPGTDVAPPNNWVSFFSGPAWRYFPEQRLWGMHLFSAKQMDLNWENPRVRQEVAEIVRWWADKGVDGFRLDVINYISKPEGLPDGNALVGQIMEFTGVEHYFYGPKLHQHLRQLRSEAFDPHGSFSVGETPGVGAEMGKLLTGDWRGELDTTFNFDHLETPGRVRFDDYRYDLNELKRYHLGYQSERSNRYWQSLFLENHDNPRMISKVDPAPEHRTALGKLLNTVLLTLRGTPFLYQGQELGAVNQRFTDVSELRDVESLNRYGQLLAEHPPEKAFAMVLAGSRDHARVPMAWSADAHAGFSSTRPWIEGDGDHLQVNAEQAMGDPDSVYSFTRALIALRREHQALVYGAIDFVEPKRQNFWSWRRTLDGVSILVVMNLSDRPLRHREPADHTLLLSSADAAPGRLAPYQVKLYRAGAPA